MTEQPKPSGIIATDGVEIIHILPGQAVKLSIQDVEKIGVEIVVEDGRIRSLRSKPA